jgi:hypothetical protein
MWGRLGPRFAVEALFLVLVAVGLGLADLRPLVIVLVMAGAWLLVSLIELLASRAPRYAPLVETPVEAPSPAPAVGVDTEPGVPPGVEAAAVGEGAEPVAVAPEPAVVETEGEVVEPPSPAPRRSWFRRLRGTSEESNDVAAAGVASEPLEAEAAEGPQQSPEGSEDALAEPAGEAEPPEQADEADPADEAKPAPEVEPEPELDAEPAPEAEAEPAADASERAPTASSAENS